MKNSHFFAMLTRIRHIRRWGLMHNTQPENLSEHTLEVSFLIHALISLHNRRFGGALDAGQGVLYALYHDCGEILTGDLPTPVKYQNPAIQTAYRQVEGVARDKLLSMLPEDLQGEYAPYLVPDESTANPYARFLKAADRLSALLKCIEEEKQGNREFVKARQSILQALQDMKMPEVDAYMEQFLPAHALTLDELD